jgi:hypothetical protein
LTEIPSSMTLVHHSRNAGHRLAVVIVWALILSLICQNRVCQDNTHYLSPWMIRCEYNKLMSCILKPKSQMCWRYDNRIDEVWCDGAS